MKNRLQKKLSLLLLGGAALALAPMTALASTPPCTSIGNTATVDYTVGGVAQIPQNGVAIPFNVGDKVMVGVASNDNNDVTVSPGATPSVLKFTITNNGNTAQNYYLTPVANATGTADPHGNAADSFDAPPPNLTVYEDNTSSGTVGSFDSNDTALTTASPGVYELPNVAKDGGTAVVYIVYTPSNLNVTDAATAGYYLLVQSRYADYSAITYGSASPSNSQIGTCNSSTPIDVVAGDLAGGATGDGVNDGQDSAEGAYIVSSAALTVTKTSTVIWDPINLFSSPKAIPGAQVMYDIKIANGGSVNATNVDVSDDLTTEITSGHLAFLTQYNDNTNSCSAGSGIFVNDGSTTTCLTNASDGDAGDFNVTAANRVTVSGLAVAAGKTTDVQFMVTIQ